MGMSVESGFETCGIGVDYTRSVERMGKSLVIELLAIIAYSKFSEPQMLFVRWIIVTPQANFYYLQMALLYSLFLKSNVNFP